VRASDPLPGDPLALQRRASGSPLPGSPHTEQPARVSVLTPDPGICLRQNVEERNVEERPSEGLP